MSNEYDEDAIWEDIFLHRTHKPCPACGQLMPVEKTVCDQCEDEFDDQL